jgi:hypothetical protein
VIGPADPDAIDNGSSVGSHMTVQQIAKLAQRHVTDSSTRSTGNRRW